MNPLARRLMIGGALTLFAGPALGVGATTWGMSRAFAQLEAAGVADPTQLAAAVGDVLIYTLIGFFIGIGGALLLISGVIVWWANRSSRPPAVPSP